MKATSKTMKTKKPEALRRPKAPRSKPAPPYQFGGLKKVKMGKTFAYTPTLLAY